MSSFDELDSASDYFWTFDESEIDGAGNINVNNRGKEIDNNINKQTNSNNSNMNIDDVDTPTNDNNTTINNISGRGLIMIESLPPQLHPAVSLGMQRVQSCYFSVGSNTSVDDLLSLWGQQQQQQQQQQNQGQPVEVETVTCNSTAAADSTNDNTSVAAASYATSGVGLCQSFDDSVNEMYVETEQETQESKTTTDKNDDSNTKTLERMYSTVSTMESLEASTATSSSCTLLYHDIMMHILTYLDAPSLAAFSETARQPNFECFYFLQLQLQRAALLPHRHLDSNSIDIDPRQQQHDDDQLSAIAGSACVSRLAALDPKEAQLIVQEYLDSNSSLRTMPLSHSLAYIRHVLRNAAFFHHNNSNGTDENHNHHFAKAAVFISVIGAASILTGSSPVTAVDSLSAAAEAVVPQVPDLAELSNILFRLGFVGSIMGAARRKMHKAGGGTNGQNADSDTVNSNNNNATVHDHHHHDHEHYDTFIMETAETIMTRMEELPLPSSMSASLRRMYDAFLKARNFAAATASIANRNVENDVKSENDDSSTTSSNASDTPAISMPLTPNPYEHLPTATASTLEIEAATKQFNLMVSSEQQKQLQQNQQQLNQQLEKNKKMASGCVGAYFRAVTRATEKSTQIVKARRKQKFDNLSDDQKQQMSTEFIDACCSDDTLHVVEELVQQIDVDGFFVGSDGTETCALHAAAFHGACKVLEFLCREINHEDIDPSKDGGLCEVNIRDTNGWTALHFAAGADSVDAVRILYHHGAKLSIEAANGYTPYQWAQRLQHHEVADEFRMILSNDSNNPNNNNNNDNGDNSSYLPVRRLRGGSDAEQQQQHGANSGSWTRLSAMRQFFSLVPAR